MGPKDPVISRVITPFVGVKNQNSYQLPGNSAGDLFGMVSENVTLFNSCSFVTSNEIGYEKVPVAESPGISLL